MGQCFGLQGHRAVSSSGQRGNKGFDYAPKRSWKHNDAHVMTQFKALSLQSEEEEEEDGGEGRYRHTRTRAISSDSEDDVYTSQPRRSGHLVFSEEENGEEEEEELDDDDEEPPQKTVLINKGFQLLPDTSPTLRHDDTIQLMKDTDDHVT